MTSWAILGCDYSAPRPDLAKLVAAGHRYVCLYLGDPATSVKTATPEYVAAVRAAGLRVLPLYETTQLRALAGHPAGLVDAGRALKLAAAWGLPDTVPIVGVTVDFNATAAQLAGPVRQYATAWRDTIGLARTMGYGGYRQIKYLFDQGLISDAFQTYAWSKLSVTGPVSWDPRAQVRQEHNAVALAGGEVDLGHATQAGFDRMWQETMTDGLDPVILPKGYVNAGAKVTVQTALASLLYYVHDTHDLAETLEQQMEILEPAPKVAAPPGTSTGLTPLG